MLPPSMMALNVGTIVNTGSFKDSSTSRSEYMALSRIASRYKIPTANANPPANPPPRNMINFGKEGVDG